MAQKPNHFCMQCTDKTSGKVGDFAYHTDNPFVALSPVFPDFVQFLDWLKENNLKCGPLASFELLPIEPEMPMDREFDGAEYFT